MLIDSFTEHTERHSIFHRAERIDKLELRQNTAAPGVLGTGYKGVLPNA